MRVKIVRGGGLAGITTETVLDSEALPAADAEVLRQRVQRAGLLGPQEPSSPPSRQPDALLYALTVEDGGQVYTHRCGEEELSDEARSLIEWVDERPERVDRVGPSG